MDHETYAPELAAIDLSRSIRTMSVVIPVRNALEFAERQVREIARQSWTPQQVIIIDSESTDGSPEIYCSSGCNVVTIEKSKFNHGATRNLGWKMCESEIIIFLTHDSIPADENCFARLCAPFADPAVGIVGGRQLPRDKAKAIERHGRLFNYPASNNQRVWPAARNLGFKAIFNSNSCAAYRRSALESIGGFPEDVIFGEDQVGAAHALLDGWTVAYAADAIVKHSHQYSLLAEFRRYFDIGVAHQQNRQLFEMFSNLSGEGRRFVISELKYLLRYAPQQIPEAAVRTSLKLLAYKLGRGEARLPRFLKQRLAMHPDFFASQPTQAGRRNTTQSPGEGGLMEPVTVSGTVSVLMATTGGERPEWLARSLESMFSQSSLPDQLVLVVDNTTDAGQQSVLARYQQDNRIKDVLILPITSGVGFGAALNFGLEHCTGKWILRMNSGDVSPPDRVKVQMDYTVENPGADLIGGWAEQFSESKSDIRIKSSPVTHGAVVQALKWRNILVDPSLLVRAETLRAVGGYRDTFAALQDWDLYVRLILAKAQLVVIPKILVRMLAGKEEAVRYGTNMRFRTFCLGRGFINFRQYLITIAAQSLFRLAGSSIRYRLYNAMTTRGVSENA
jgi:rhamnosyltransferase